MNETQLKENVRKMALLDRLYKCRRMIGAMCSERRPPKMSIPVSSNDEDFFISTTLEDAIKAIKDKSND